MLKLSIIQKLQEKYLNAPNPIFTEHKEYDLLLDGIKNSNPVKYYIFFTIGEKIDDVLDDIHTIYKNIKYWFLYRLHPEYRKYWSVIPTTLNIGYHDPDNLMLHTNMQILCDFYQDILDGKSTTDWDYDEKFINATNTMKEIYNWWKVERIEKHVKINGIYDECIEVPIDDMFDGIQTSEKLHNRSKYDMVHKIEEYINAKDTEMLHKLVDIRLFLWD
jgi:hypothetical protein